MHILGLQKILGYLFMPAGLLWMGLLAMSIWCLCRKQRGLGVGLIGIFLFYTLAGNRWVGEGLMASLEQRIAQRLPENAEPFDAICVLGGGSELDLLGGPQLSDYGDRISAAAGLWHSGQTRLLVASGSSLDDQAQRNLGEETRSLWLGMGVPPEAIRVVPQPCRITREEIAAIKQLQVKHAWKRVAILSSAWHLPRVMALARQANLEATPIGADWRSRARPFQGYFLIPQAWGFTLVQLACWEYLGRWVGR